MCTNNDQEDTGMEYGYCEIYTTKKVECYHYKRRYSKINMDNLDNEIRLLIMSYKCNFNSCFILIFSNSLWLYYMNPTMPPHLHTSLCTRDKHAPCSITQEGILSVSLTCTSYFPLSISQKRNNLIFIKVGMPLYSMNLTIPPHLYTWLHRLQIYIKSWYWKKNYFITCRR